MRRNMTFSLPPEFVGAWLLMLGLGNVHDSYTSVPALGYGTCLLLAFALGFSVSTAPLAHYTLERN